MKEFPLELPKRPSAGELLPSPSIRPAPDDHCQQALNGLDYRRLELDRAVFKRTPAALTQALRDNLIRPGLAAAFVKARIPTAAPRA